MGGGTVSGGPGGATSFCVSGVWADTQKPTGTHESAPEWCAANAQSPVEGRRIGAAGAGAILRVAMADPRGLAPQREGGQT